jgi:hypothetical protein
MQSLPVELLRSVVDLFTQFGKIATTVPQVILLVSGAIIVAVSVGLFAYLAFGALVRPAGNLPTPERGHRDRRDQEFRGR